MKIRLLLETKNVAIFIKICFHLKRGCMKMLKHAETFYADKSCYMAIVFFFYQFRCFQKRNLGCNFQTLFARKRGLAHPNFLYENELLRHFLSYYLRRMATFLVLEIRFFRGVRFLGGPFFLRSRIGRLDRL